MATRRSSRIRTATPNVSMTINSGSDEEDDSQETANVSKNAEKPKSGSKITSYFSPKQRAAAAASAASESDNSNVSQKYFDFTFFFCLNRW